MDTALLGVVYVILGSMDGQMDVLSEDVSRCRISNYIVSLNEKFGSKVLEENHLDQAIEQEVGKANRDHGYFQGRIFAPLSYSCRPLVPRKEMILTQLLGSFRIFTGNGFHGRGQKEKSPSSQV